MGGGLLKAIWDLLTALGKVFANASPVASILTVATPAVALVFTIRGHIHRAVKDKEGRILDLEEDLKNRDKKLGSIRLSLKETEERCEAISGRLAETALEAYEKEMKGEDQNYAAAEQALLKWLDDEGHTASTILFHRAEWAAAHAVQDLRASGLVAAEAYAIAAVALRPVNQYALSLLEDIAAMREEEGQTMPSLQQSLTGLNEHASMLFDIDLAKDADEAEEEANRRLNQDHYSAALPVIQRAVLARIKTVGKSALLTLRIRLLEARVLDLLGRSQEALAIAEDVAGKREQHPDLGPRHHETLVSRNLVARILDDLGRRQEALAIAEDVAGKMAQHPDLGPDHPDTLAARYLVARTLDDLGRSQEALAIAEDVAGKREQHPDLGPRDRGTLVSRHLVARILIKLRRNEEALAIAEDVSDKREQHPDLGPRHRETLFSRHLVARILWNLGHNEEALAIVRDVAGKMEQHPDLGPHHPDTLSNRHLVARILDDLGRRQEALAIAVDVAGKMEQHPDLGPHHPDTLVSRHLVARILDELGRPQEALAIAVDVAGKMAQHPDLGPRHPDTLTSQNLALQILYKLGLLGR